MKWRCPICQQATNSAIHADFPFCSERCRLLDLGRWADETYRISSPAPAIESENEPDDQHSS
ncbi:MAG: DNA gyrase inhibitor YacG [Acidobacteria bacterium]|nr:DNA gyrase inhibitor YacG [Acidobacteriota bacterium]